MTFEELHNSLPKIDFGLKKSENIEDISEEKVYNQLDCLLNPKKKSSKPNIWDDQEKINKINFDENKLTKDALAVVNILKQKDKLIYAMIAPAFLGQFSDLVTPGKLRSALKFLGFTGMVEVSLFADILTLKEALEFDKKINDKSDFMLTSCCCPMWIAMLRKQSDLLSHVPGSVSPMIACARPIKILHPEAITVFIGPCMAKKSEAREKDLIGAVDHVLTFQEIASIFDVFNIKPEAMQESNRDHSSRAGRIYARAGGVAQAVFDTVKRLNPNKNIVIKTANGVPECKKMIEELQSKTRSANFFEGMGCVGGCVGGPKKIIDKETATQNVNNYGDNATYPTPIDNPYVIKLLHLLGFDTVESLIEDNKIFARHFE